MPPSQNELLAAGWNVDQSAAENRLSPRFVLPGPFDEAHHKSKPRINIHPVIFHSEQSRGIK